MSEPVTSETTQPLSGFVASPCRQSGTVTLDAKRPVDFFDLEWHAAWIAPVEADELPLVQRPVQQLAAAVGIDGEIVRAQLHVTAHGIYEIFVNESRVGDGELTPGWTAYRSRLQVQTFDVTALLSTGENVIGGATE